MASREQTLTVEVIGSQTTFTLRELCERADVHAEFVVKLVNYGIVTPVEESRSVREWRFDLAELARLRKAQRLQRDLKINLPGLAMSLELLEEVQQMRREVDRLNRQLDNLMDEG